MSEAAPNKRGRRDSGQGRNRDGPSKRQEKDSSINQQINNKVSLNQQIPEALRAQNNLLQKQNTLLQSIDAKLGPNERQDRRSNHMRGSGRAPHPNEIIQRGLWKFVDSPQTVKRREAHQKRLEERSTCYSSYDSENSGSFGKVDDEGMVLMSDMYPTNPPYSYYAGLLSQCPDGQPPNWTLSGWDRPRSLLPHLVFNNRVELKLKSGVYLLTIKFSSCTKNDPNCEAGIIIGEMDFNNQGYVMAQGADWDRLLNNQRQTQLPYANGARGVPTWMRRKICEPWEDGDMLMFRIDTNENTVVFQRGNTPERLFWNVLAFTNNRLYPEFLRVYVYCVIFPGQSSESNEIKLTIIP